MDFSLMKYGELQALAKSHGIKANQRAEIIIECLKKVLGSLKNDEGDTDTDRGRRKSVSPAKTAPQSVSSKLAADESKSSLIMRSKKQRNDKMNSKPEVTEKSPAASPTKPAVAPSKPAAAPSKPAAAAASKPSLPLKTPSPKSRSFRSSRSSGRKLSASEADGKKSSGRKESAKKEDALKVTRGSSQKNENKSKKRILETSGEEERLEPMRKKLRSSAGNTKQDGAEKKQAGDNPSSSNIPRFVRPSSGKKKMEKKTFDADYWSKVHQKNQERMESIGDYQKKKQERAKLLMSSKKPSRTSASARKSPRHLAAVPSAQKVFVPDVTSIDKVNFNFSKIPSRTAARETAHNVTYTKIARELLTPPTKMFSSKNPNKMAADSTSKRKSMLSPKPSHNNTLTNSVSRLKFDLAASLDKPLTWKPYKGKVKPLSEQDEDDARYAKKSRLRSDPKEVQLRTKQEKRAETRSAWKSRRDTLVMSRRSVKK